MSTLPIRPFCAVCYWHVKHKFRVRYRYSNTNLYTGGSCTIPLPGTVPNYGTVFCVYLELQKTANALLKNNVKNNAGGGKHLSTLRGLNYAIAVSRPVSMKIKKTS